MIPWLKDVVAGAGLVFFIGCSWVVADTLSAFLRGA